MDYDGDGPSAEETIVAEFFAAHEEVYPGEDDLREELRTEKHDALLRDAAALLMFGLAATSICSIIRRDMRKRPSIPGQIAPRTIRFCVRSVERAAKVGDTVRVRPAEDASQKAAARAEAQYAISADDWTWIDARVAESGYARLTLAEKWRWHAYRRVSRKHLGYNGPPPFDPNNEWLDRELLRLAEVAWHARGKGATDDDEYVSTPKPAEDVVRPNWRSIRRSDLTKAELALALPIIEEGAKIAQKAIDDFVRTHKITPAPHDFYGPPWRPTLVTHPLKAEHDPEVQRRLQQIERGEWKQ